MKKFLLFTLIFGLGFSSSQSTDAGNLAISMTPDEMRAALAAMDSLSEDWVVVDPANLQQKSRTPSRISSDNSDLTEQEEIEFSVHPSELGLEEGTDEYEEQLERYHNWLTAQQAKNYTLPRNTDDPYVLIKDPLRDFQKEHAQLGINLKKLKKEMNNLKKTSLPKKKDQLKILKSRAEDIKRRRALLRKEMEILIEIGEHAQRRLELEIQDAIKK